MPDPSTPPLTAFSGLVSKRYRWGLTWRGRIVTALGLCALSGAGILGIHSFLGVNAAVESQIMVVEGWISMRSLSMAADTFKADDYKMLCTVGGIERSRGNDAPNSTTSSQITANQFLEMGLPESVVFVVESGDPERDRTYTSAVALRDWFVTQGIAVDSLNVVTEGVHSRRSRLMFQKAFGDAVKIGVISVPDGEYDPRYWWRYSEGVKEVISESAAYLYARFLFHPES